MSDVAACPECDSASVETRQGDTMLYTGDRSCLYCRECGAEFDQPVHRPPHVEHHPSGLEKRLIEVDPDEVSG